MENLFAAWAEFRRGKEKKPDVQEFGLRLYANIRALHEDLVAMRYAHGPYQAFGISDPKPRRIHKASVRDRLLHHAIFRILYPAFDRTFIADSFSCRVGKGTHAARARFRKFCGEVSRNGTRTAWVLKCDVRKFFASIDQKILMAMLARRLSDARVVWLLGRVVESFDSGTSGRGLPLGNLTSQLLVNIYMDEFDKFAKHQLQAARYVRYADDFVFVSEQRGWLLKILPKIRAFLHDRLALELHPDKISLKTVASGVDFLGWVHFADHRVLRTATARRMLARVAASEGADATVRSYLGMLSHGNARKLADQVAALARSLNPDFEI